MTGDGWDRVAHSIHTTIHKELALLGTGILVITDILIHHHRNRLKGSQ